MICMLKHVWVSIYTKNMMEGLTMHDINVAKYNADLEQRLVASLSLKVH